MVGTFFIIPLLDAWGFLLLREIAAAFFIQTSFSPVEHRTLKNTGRNCSVIKNFIFVVIKLPFFRKI